jgi:pyroglutamyl-peptidase
MKNISITGFGEFNGVKVNPSMKVVEAVQKKSEALSIFEGNIKFNNLEVSVEKCKEIATLSDNETLFIHIGVDAGSSHIKLEQFAYNNMTFRVPDQRGFQPLNEPIEGEISFDVPLQTCFQLNELSACLNCKGYEFVKVSSDPGRFLCNYLYFQSLNHQRKNNLPLKSIFIHIPLFEVIPLDLQVNAIIEIINTLITQ